MKGKTSYSVLFQLCCLKHEANMPVHLSTVLGWSKIILSHILDIDYVLYFLKNAVSVLEDAFKEAS